VGVIGNYLHLGVSPLMARWLPLFKMTVEAPPECETPFGFGD
jgi:hypothetical protein